MSSQELIATAKAMVGTQMIATFIAAYGLFMPPIGWGWPVAVWGYALAWFHVYDRVKLLAYRIIDPQRPLLSPRLVLTGDKR